MLAAEDNTEQVIKAKLSKDSLEKFRNNFRVLPDADDFELK